MVDPLTVVAVICALISASKACHDIITTYHQKSKLRGKDTGSRDGVLDIFTDLVQQFNALASKFGRGLEDQLDGETSCSILNNFLDGNNLAIY